MNLEQQREVEILTRLEADALDVATAAGGGAGEILCWFPSVCRLADERRNRPTRPAPVVLDEC